MAWKWLKILRPQVQQRKYQRIDRTIVTKEKLSMIYAFCAFGSIISVNIAIWMGKNDWADYYGLKSEEEKSTRSGQMWAKSLGIQHAKVITIKGFTKVDEYEVKGSPVPETFEQ